ncbi:MAG TPA: hypothetical protein VGN61_13255 [Verrucomicrobiae bacterium]|jgi:hypothetical protein
MSTLRTSETDFLPLEATNMFLAYDTAETAQSARGLVKNVVAQLKSELAVHTKLWRFDPGSVPAAVTEAQTEAADADVMIVALGASNLLPKGLLRWLNEWAKNRHIETAALGVLITGARAQDAAPAVAQLRQLALRFGLDFIYHADASEADNLTAIVLSPPRTQRWTWPAREHTYHPDVPISEWGIND